MDEMNRLRELLDKEGIAWVDNTSKKVARTQSPDWSDWHSRSKNRWSCICGAYTYGGPQGMLEVWFGDNDPQGWLTAKEALKLIKARVGRCFT